MKKIKSLIAGLIAMVFLVACGGGGTAPANQKPTVTIEVSGSMQESENITFKAIALDSDGQVVDYQWSGAVAGNAVEVTDTFSAGTYTATVTVTDDEGATASASKTFTISAVMVTALEKLTGIKGLKTGDNIFLNATGNWEKTDQSCQFDYIDRGNGQELDATTIQLGSLRWLTTFIETDVDGKEMVVCNKDTYVVTSDNYNDMIIAHYSDKNIIIVAMSDHSDPNNPAWVRTNEELNSSKIIK